MQIEIRVLKGGENYGKRIFIVNFLKIKFKLDIKYKKLYIFFFWLKYFKLYLIVEKLYFRVLCFWLNLIFFYDKLFIKCQK